MADIEMRWGSSLEIILTVEIYGHVSCDGKLLALLRSGLNGSPSKATASPQKLFDLFKHSLLSLP